MLLLDICLYYKCIQIQKNENKYVEILNGSKLENAIIVYLSILIGVVIVVQGNRKVLNFRSKKNPKPALCTDFTNIYFGVGNNEGAVKYLTESINKNFLQ